MDVLKKRRAALKTLTDEGLEAVLSCVVQVEGAAAFRIAPPLQRKIARLGIGLDFSVLSSEAELEHGASSAQECIRDGRRES